MVAWMFVPVLRSAVGRLEGAVHVPADGSRKQARAVKKLRTPT